MAHDLRAPIRAMSGLSAALLEDVPLNDVGKNYAKRIQRALFASEALLKKNLPEYFVLYKPKDIVSGDFYWAEQIDSRFMLAVCDCTGHGVPGAFMSMLGVSSLNEAILEKNISQPHEILNDIRNSILYV